MGEAWPTYSGDYSGKRYSTLKEINQSNVKNLTLAWVSRVIPGAGTAGAGRGFGQSPIIIGGEGTGEAGGGACAAGERDVAGVGQQRHFALIQQEQ